MAKEVLIFMHTPDDAPGYVADILQRHNIPFRVIHSYKNEVIPNLEPSIAGLIFLGGSMSVNAGIVWLEQEVKLIRQALSANIPIVGHCLGGQLISLALDQPVIKSLVPEIGWHRCYSLETSAANDWLGKLANDFIMFHWHVETFEIPPQAMPLFSSKYCQNQAYSYGDNVLAMQCHVEMTESLLTSWLDKYWDELLAQSDSEQNHQQIRAQLIDSIPELNRVAEQLYSRWIKTLTL